MPQDTAAGTVTSVLIALSAAQPVYARKAGRATSAQKKAASFYVVFAATGHFAVDARTLLGVAAVELRTSATIVPKKPQRMKQRKNMWNLSVHAPNVTFQFVNPARQQQRQARLSTSLLLVSRRDVIVSNHIINGATPEGCCWLEFVLAALNKKNTSQFCVGIHACAHMMKLTVRASEILIRVH